MDLRYLCGIIDAARTSENPIVREAFEDLIVAVKLAEGENLAKPGDGDLVPDDYDMVALFDKFYQQCDDFRKLREQKYENIRKFQERKELQKKYEKQRFEILKQTVEENELKRKV